MMKRIFAFIIVAIMFCTFFGCSFQKKICAYDGCEETVEANHTYCRRHRCLFCEDAVDEYSIIRGHSTHYCSKHRCKYDGVFGQCTDGIIGVDYDDSLQYCEKHKDLDLSEFGKAEYIASNWNKTIAADSRKKTKGLDFSYPPFSFTGDFYTTKDGYYFEVYDSDYFKYGYIIVLKENGELHCDGMRYK